MRLRGYRTICVEVLYLRHRSRRSCRVGMYLLQYLLLPFVRKPRGGRKRLRTYVFIWLDYYYSHNRFRLKGISFHRPNPNGRVLSEGLFKGTIGDSAPRMTKLSPLQSAPAEPPADCTHTLNSLLSLL